MTLRFASVGSGSRGNGTLVTGGDSAILIDCGFSYRKLKTRLAALEMTPQDLDGVLVTHEHSDHASGVARLQKETGVPVYTTAGTARGAKLSNVSTIHTQSCFQVGGLGVTPVTVPHDSREPVQFVINHGALRLGVLTDLGHVTPHVIDHFSHCDGLLVEANHDLDLLWRGPYPAAVKRRVAGPHGHLNNQQSADLLKRIVDGRLQHLVAGHISEQNNCVATVDSLLRSEVHLHDSVLTLATQDSGFGWLSLQ